MLYAEERETPHFSNRESPGRLEVEGNTGGLEEESHSQVAGERKPWSRQQGEKVLTSVSVSTRSSGTSLWQDLAGFRTGWSYIDYIFVLQQILE